MHEFKFYGSATVGTKGQIVIPAEARDELCMTEGTKVVIVKAPHHNGFMVLNAGILEAHLADVQDKLKDHSEN